MSRALQPTILQSYVSACMKHCAHNAIPETRYQENIVRIAALCLSWRPIMLVDYVGQIYEAVRGLARACAPV